MKVLVTGGAGFIGSHIVDNLVYRGYEVIVIDNLSSGKLSNLNPKAKFYKLDITESLDSIFSNEKPEIVIHCAGQVMLRYSIENPILDANTNILGTINILEACRKNNVKKIIYTSTGGARYGEPEYLPIDEKHPISPCSPYGISKHTAEHYIINYSKLYGISYMIFCFGNVYGPRDNPSSGRLIPLFCSKILNGEDMFIYGDGNQTRDFIYAIDISDFIVESINKNPESKIFNLAYGEQISVNKVIEILSQLSSYNGKITNNPSINGEVRDILLDTSLVKKELGWNPKHDIYSGLKETFEWFKKNS